MKNFERELPEGYEEVYHIDAANKKTGLILNGVAFAIVLIFIAVAFLTVRSLDFSSLEIIFGLSALIVSTFLYIVLHELVHGIAYKMLTKEKLTFGITWSAAFCSVPNIFVYRKTAIIALLAPVCVFTVVFVTLSIVFYNISGVFYLLFMFLQGFNLGGASGDLYMLWIFLFKFKDKTTLMRDTGPEQFLYVKK